MHSHLRGSRGPPKGFVINSQQRISMDGNLPLNFQLFLDSVKNDFSILLNLLRKRITMLIGKDQKLTLWNRNKEL